MHIHTPDPGRILHYVSSMGTLHEINIRNMDEQHQDWMEMQKSRLPTVDTAIVTVASGDGITDVFRSLGAAEVVPGGQTMNPSTKHLLQAVEAAASDKVIILPNNKNIVLTAEQVKPLTQKTVVVVPTQTIPQGVAALLAFDYEADFDTNTQLMEKARVSVKTIEVTRAVRSTQIGGLKIRRKQAIGLLDNELVAVDDSITAVLYKLLAKLDLSKAEVVTIYYGDDTELAEAEQIGVGLREEQPHLQIEVVSGGQPYYNYIISVE